jgi:hypothetical protein
MLIAVFGLLLVLSGGVTPTVSRSEPGRPSASIVWIHQQRSEQACRCEQSAPLLRVPITTRTEYHSAIVSRLLLSDLFQRPPPQNR